MIYICDNHIVDCVHADVDTNILAITCHFKMFEQSDDDMPSLQS